MRLQFNIHEVPRVVSLCHFVIYSPIFALGLINEKKQKRRYVSPAMRLFHYFIRHFSHVLHGASLLLHILKGQWKGMVRDDGKAQRVSFRATPHSAPGQEPPSPSCRLTKSGRKSAGKCLAGIFKKETVAIVYQVMRRKTRFVKARAKGRKGTICYQRDKPERDQKCVRTARKRSYNLMDEGTKTTLEGREEAWEGKLAETGRRKRKTESRAETFKTGAASGGKCLWMCP